MKMSNALMVGVLAIVAGILVLIWPEILRWVIGLFLLVWGILTVMEKK
jgi:uncharacterized membrane protein HdeD (DUF308 family)